MTASSTVATILVATPHAAFGELLRISLEESGQYQVRLVPAATEARALCGRYAFQLAILDSALSDEPFGPLCKALLECQPAMRLMVIPPENDPRHTSLGDLKPHAYLSRPFYLPDLFENVNRLLQERKDELIQQGDLASEHANPGGLPPWLQEPLTMTSYLEKELAGTQALAGIVARNAPGEAPTVRASAGSLAKESALELAGAVLRYWNRDEKSDIMRYIRPAADKKDYLVYATGITGNLLLILIFHHAAPLSQVRPQTREVALTMAKDPPDNYRAGSPQIGPQAGKPLADHAPEENRLSPEPNLVDPALDADLEPEEESAMPLIDLSALLGAIPSPDPLKHGSGIPAGANVPTTPLWQVSTSGEPEDQAFQPHHENGRAWKDNSTSQETPAVDETAAGSAQPASLEPAATDAALKAEEPAAAEPPAGTTEPAPADFASIFANAPLDQEAPPEEAPPANIEDLASAIHWEAENPSLHASEGSAAPDPSLSLDNLPLDEIWALEAPARAAPEPVALEPLPPLVFPVESPATPLPATEYSEETRPIAESPAPRAVDSLVPRAETGEEIAEIDLLEDTRPRILPTITQLNQLEPVSPALALLNYTCVLVPRLPHHYLIGELADRLPQWVGQLCLAFGWRLDGIAVRPEYLQWSVQVAPAVSPGNLVRIVRQRLSQNVFLAYPHLVEQNPSGDFWAIGYLIVSGPQPPSAQLLRDYIFQTRRRQGVVN